MAVPPGLVTPSLSMPGCWPLSMRSLAEPSTVCAASCSEARRESPTFTPASASASMMRKMYAGPLPERPVTASSCDSSSTTVSPTLSKMVLAVARSASVACSPSAIPVAPAPTVAGVLGMARTIRGGAGFAGDGPTPWAEAWAAGCRRRSMAAMGTPAATLMTSLSCETSGAMERST